MQVPKPPRPFIRDPASSPRSRADRYDRARKPRGQAMVEFALVLPLLLILLLGVADFGRLFSAGITIEAAARNAAEVGAIERLRNRPDPATCDPVCMDAYYADLHEMVAKVACSESRLQPNATFIEADDPGTPAFNEERTCPSMPVIRACVRDNLDPRCGAPIAGFADPVPPECNRMSEAWGASGGTDVSHSVEVRVCYHFTTLFNLHLSLGLGFAINLGDVWIQRSRVFVLDCPPPPADISQC